MSWMDIEIAEWRFSHKRPYQVNIEWTEFVVIPSRAARIRPTHI